MFWHSKTSLASCSAARDNTLPVLVPFKGESKLCCCPQMRGLYVLVCMYTDDSTLIIVCYMCEWKRENRVCLWGLRRKREKTTLYNLFFFFLLPLSQTPGMMFEGSVLTFSCSSDGALFIVQPASACNLRAPVIQRQSLLLLTRPTKLVTSCGPMCT